MASQTSTAVDNPKRVDLSLEKNNNIVTDAKEKEAYEEGDQGEPLDTAVRYPTTYWETLFHLIKGNIGSGMFAMGDAFKNSGLLMGPILTIVLSTICVYGNHLLARCSKELARRRKLARYPMYPDTMEWAFQDGPEPFRKYSKTIRRLVEIFLTIAQLGFCAIYFLYISSTLQKILGKYGILLGAHVWMVIIFVPMASTAMVRSLKFLVPFSVLANLLTIAAVFLTVYLSMLELPPISSRPALAEISKIPLFFGTVVFCFEGIGLVSKLLKDNDPDDDYWLMYVLPLQSEMKQPDMFGGLKGVLNVGMIFVSSMLVGLGFIGYLKYGEDVEGSLTHNLPSGSISSMVVQLTLAAGLLFSYALQFHVAAITVWPELDRKYGPFRHPMLAEIGVRLGLAFITFVAAEVVPMLGLLISLLGSVGSTALVLVFPPLCDLALHWGHTPGPDYLFDVLSIVLAVVGFATGSYCSLRDIIHAFYPDT